LLPKYLARFILTVVVVVVVVVVVAEAVN